MAGVKKIELQKKARQLVVDFNDGRRVMISFSDLRARSPSAENRAQRGGGQSRYRHCVFAAGRQLCGAADFFRRPSKRHLFLGYVARFGRCDKAMTPPSTADFGFAQVPIAEKTALVKAVFTRAAPHYDFMNDVMSAGGHRLWKRIAASMCEVRAGMTVLDLAGGSGDITRLLLPRVSPNGQVMLADINTDMLALAKKRLGNAAGVRFIHCNAEKLPFVECRFDRVIIAFGLRNIGKRDTALAQMRRVLRIGGKIVILEFSPPSGVLAGVQDFYLRRVLPFLGRQLADDEESYRYLGESILRFPPPPTLKEMLNDAGFEHVRQFQFAAGAVVLHSAWRTK